MISASTQLITSRKMGIYDPFQQVSMWEDAFKGDISPNTGASTILQVDAGLPNKSEFNSHELTGPSRNDEEGNNTADKIAHQEFVTVLDSNSVKRAHVRRRLAQNREAARKSRLRKKAYVQQLETSRLKLAQLELELEKARKQGVYVGSALDTSHLGFSGNVNSGIAAFEMEYAHWVEEQNRQIFELRNALQAHVTEIELRMLVEGGLNHYHNLFRMKADAAKADVFYLMSGVWRTTTERFFLWIGGFRPSELLNVLRPQLEPLSDQQVLSLCNLRQSSQQAEDALSLGMEKLQQSLALSIGAESVLAGNYGSQIAAAMEKLEALEGFVNQADHLRQQTLQQMSRILTTHQAARGLLALGEYFHRLRALSSLWAARPREPE